jgi:CheY-like chemotaxis protein
VQLSPTGGAVTILVIEDSRFLQMAIDRVLRKAGYQTVVVSDGEQGLRLAREQFPDLILLDIMLPSLPGTGVLHALKQNPQTSKIPVIVLTSLSKQNEGKLKGVGADAFMEKSALDLENDSEGLIQIIEKTLRRTRADAAKSAAPSS